jgi:hypothetical protein
MKNIVIFIILFVCLITLVFYFGNKTSQRENGLLKNNVFFKGIVKNIQVSDNHAFGIISLILDSANIKEFDSKISTEMYPYKVIGKNAELYTSIPAGLEIGDTVTVNSNILKEFYKTKSKQRYEGSLQMVTGDINIDYIKNNSFFK